MLALERVPPAMIRFAAAVAAILALASCASPAPSNPTVSTASPMRSPSGTPPVETLLCEHYEGLLPSGVERDSCPPAIAAVRAVVASLDLPVVRIVIEPGVFLCDDPWPMPGSSVACLSPSLLAGTTMRGWVTFSGSAKVAAVILSRDGPPSAAPSPTWTATIAAFAAPPAGWVMP
jgi:hypothetical protein